VTEAVARVAEARTSELFSPARRALTIGLVLTITLVAFEALATATILPLVKQDLGRIDLYGWTISAFFLGNLIGIVVSGGMLDRGPILRPFAGGLAIFAVGLAIAGLAPSMEVLVAARFLQGLGGGTVSPSSYVAIGRSLPERLRSRMFALLSTAWVVPGLIGPAIAGIIGEVIHWRAVFLGLLPFLVVSGGIAILALRGVPGPAEEEHAAARSTARRLPSALIVAAGAGILVAALTDERVLVAVGGALIGLVLLIPGYRRLTPPGTLRIRPGLPAATILRGLLTFAFFGVDVYIALLLVDVRHTSAAFAGLALTSATLTWTTGSWVQARRQERWGARRLIMLGFGTVAVGIGLTALVLLDPVPPAFAILTWGIAGLGMGFAYSAFSIVVLRDAPPEEQGSASSALQLSETVGTALGAGLAGAFVAAAGRADQLPTGLLAVIILGLVAANIGVLLSRRIPH
jgi:MFS family permease